MGARYNAKGDQTLTTIFTTALTIGSNATTVQRNFIKRYILFIALTPSASTISWSIQRCTALGTGSAVTPQEQEPSNRAAQAAVAKNHSIEPTYSAGAFLMEAVGLNAQAAFVWVAGPEEAIVTPATAGNGIGFQALHASRTEDFGVQANWEE